jgi:hypothetical protein
MLAMERDPFEGGSDVGRDVGRDLGDEPPALIRDAAPDVLSPIDASAPVSGHVPAPETTRSAAETPEHDWSAAKGLVRPAFRPAGTQGLELSTIERDTLLAHATTSHAQPIIDVGPVGLTVVYTIPAGGFDIVVNGDHLLSWGIEPVELQDAALANLAAWSATAPWTEETSGDRHLISSDTGEGFDAVRILLPDTIAHLERTLSPFGRVLVGVPDHDLLAAAALSPGDDEFATLFSEFIVEQSGGADEPIDRRMFELVGGQLVEAAG